MVGLHAAAPPTLPIAQAATDIATRPPSTVSPPRSPSFLQRHVATFASELLGPEGAAQFAWSPQGDLLAAAGARVRALRPLMPRL